MTFTLPESLWLHGHGFDNLLLAYPSAHRAALAELGRLDSDRPPIVMVDSVQHLDYVERRRPRPCGRSASASSWRGRSPPDAASSWPRSWATRPHRRRRRPPAREARLGEVIRFVKRRSAAEIAERRAAVVAAVREVAPVLIVNGGSTGSIHSTRREDVVTEVTAGSGFYAPTLFDRYAAFRLAPAAMFAMPVVRRPSGSVATLHGGGHLASGAAGRDRLPAPQLPRGLRLDPFEGAREIQTPVIGAAAVSLRVGDDVYLRHAKAGELCERFDNLYLLSGGEIVDELPTYRGEGRCEL
jgi:D-serine deaminase-like pyridoxal phosphate-dependent protein